MIALDWICVVTPLLQESKQQQIKEYEDSQSDEQSLNQLKQQKAVLAREVKSLRAELEVAKNQQKAYKQEYHRLIELSKSKGQNDHSHELP